MTQNNFWCKEMIQLMYIQLWCCSGISMKLFLRVLYHINISDVLTCFISFEQCFFGEPIKKCDKTSSLVSFVMFTYFVSTSLRQLFIDLPRSTQKTVNRLQFKTVLLRDRKRHTARTPASKSFQNLCPKFCPIFCPNLGGPPNLGLGGSPPTLPGTRAKSSKMQIIDRRPTFGIGAPSLGNPGSATECNAPFCTRFLGLYLQIMLDLKIIPQHAMKGRGGKIKNLVWGVGGGEAENLNKLRYFYWWYSTGWGVMQS